MRASVIRSRARRVPWRGAAAVLLALTLGCDRHATGGDGLRVPFRIEVYAGDAQTGEAGAELPQPLVARVLNHLGGTLEGVPVVFTITGGDGLVATSSSGMLRQAPGVTRRNGLATARWLLGAFVADSQRVEVRVRTRGGEPLAATFRAVPRPAAPELAEVAGNEQTGVVGIPLARALTVRTADRFGNPAAGVVVRWAVAAGGGSVSPDSSVTDAQGLASAWWTLGQATADSQRVEARLATGSVRFRADARAGPAARLAMVSGDSQTVLVANRLAQPLVVRVVDRFGNAVAGTAVVWTVEPSTPGSSYVPGSVSKPVVVSGEDGVASVVWTAGSRAEWARTTAAAAAIAPVEFTARFLPGPPFRLQHHGLICYDPGSSVVSSSFRIVDSHANGIPGVPVAVRLVQGTGTVHWISGNVSDPDGAVAVRWSGGPGVTVLLVEAAGLSATSGISSQDQYC